MVRQLFVGWVHDRICRLLHQISQQERDHLSSRQHNSFGGNSLINAWTFEFQEYLVVFTVSSSLEGTRREGDRGRVDLVDDPADNGLEIGHSVLQDNSFHGAVMSASSDPLDVESLEDRVFLFSSSVLESLEEKTKKTEALEAKHDRDSIHNVLA